jgi:alkylation response protein AidB-like acyl-CoA dehydrogenase
MFFMEMVNLRRADLRQADEETAVDFEFTEADDAFRAELREFLAARLPPWWRGYSASDEAFEVVKRVTSEMAERGWLTMAWPREYGGQDAPIWRQVVLKEEMTAHHEPRGPQYMSLNWIGPSIMMFGTDEQKRFHLGRIARGEGFWLQGFSEPDAGSDLASLRTRAARDGDEYVISGEKIWTSHILRGEWVFLLARTDPAAPKHKGISVFLIPMDTPGISRVPITSMVGTKGRVGHIYFDDVRVPASSRLGPENEGWRVAMQALGFERAGNPRWLGSFRQLDALKEYAAQAPVNGHALYDEPFIGQRFAQLTTEAEVARLSYYRHISAEAAGLDTRSIAAIARIQGTVSNQNVSRFAMELLGEMSDVAQQGEDWIPLGGQAGATWMEGLVATIVAGTLEVNKNTLATRGLGLPR